MNNTLLQLKVKQRLNKLASNDYDNIECWQIVEAFNKGQFDWCRRNLHGTNIVREGDEQSTTRIDDFQILLKTIIIPATDKNDYYETDLLPDNYLRWKRLSVKASNDCCKNRKMVVYLVENGDIDILLRDSNYKPSFDWAETIATLEGDRIKIYTNNEFEVAEARLTFYRYPISIQVKGCNNPGLNITSTLNVECEFKDDITEVLIDEAVKILAGDIESFNQMQRAQQSVENNN